ncbi:MAG: hypothetical protein AAGE52_17075 [Myxococcota bacterium]
MRTLTTLFVATALMAGTGCTWDLDFDDPTYGSESEALSTSDGVLEGSAGDVRNVEGSARVHDAYAYDSHAYIELRARGRGGVIMQGYHIDGFDQLRPGDVLTFGTDRYDYYTGGSEVYVSTTGCAGPSGDNWDFDQGADEVTVVVEQGPEPGTIRLDIDSRFDSYYDGGSQNVRGSVTVAVY